MTEQDKQTVIEALEYALNDCPIKDGDHQTHFNTFANAIEIVKNCTIPNVVDSFEGCNICGEDKPPKNGCSICRQETA